MAGVSGELAGVAPGGRFRWIFFTVSGGKGGGGLQDPHRRQMGAVRRRWGAELVWEREGGQAAVQSSSIRVWEGDGRQRTERRQPAGRAALEKEGGGQAETVARAEIQKNKKKNQF
jgi:hypothetical protein